MAAFKYIVQDRNGKVVRGVMEAPDRGGLQTLFEERHYRVLSIGLASSFESAFQKFLDRFRDVSRENVILFTRQLSTLTHSGLPLAQALESLAWQQKNDKFRIVIETIKNDIEKGKSFSEALRRFPHLFSNLYLGMIESGEAAGILDEVLERLSAIGLQELEIRSKLAAAFTYPVILVAISILVIMFLLIGAIPKFMDIFRASHATLPLPTMILLGISTAIRQYWLFILAVIAASGFGVYRFYQRPQGRLFFDRAVLKIPIFGELYLKVLIARLTRSISALTKSGVPLLRALEVSRGMVTNVVIAASLDQIRTGISQGKSLTELFQHSGIFPPMVVQMVSVGETTGKLDEMLSEVAKFYDLEIDYFLRNLASSLEPILLLFMGLMVGFIALAVLMPIFNVVKVFRHG